MLYHKGILLDGIAYSACNSNKFGLLVHKTRLTIPSSYVGKLPKVHICSSNPHFSVPMWATHYKWCLCYCMKLEVKSFAAESAPQFLSLLLPNSSVRLSITGYIDTVTYVTDSWFRFKYGVAFFSTDWTLGNWKAEWSKTFFNRYKILANNQWWWFPSV